MTSKLIEKLKSLSFLRPFGVLLYSLLWIQYRGLQFVIKNKDDNNSLSRYFHNLESNQEVAIVLLYRRHKFSNEKLIPNLLDNIMDSVKAISRGHVVNFFIEQKMGKSFFSNYEWTKKVIKFHTKTGKRCVFITLDGNLMGFPGFWGILQARSLRRLLMYSKSYFCLFMFDALEPHILTNFCSIQYPNSKLFLMCNSPVENKLFPVSSVGPIIYGCYRLDSKEYKELNARNFDIHLPRPNYSPRKEIVEQVISNINKRSELKEKKLSIGGNIDKNAEFDSHLADVKIVIVTNSMITGVTGNWPRPKSPKSHIVSYNFEAIEKKCLLITQRCRPLAEMFEEFKEVIFFDDPREITELLIYFLQNLETAQAITNRGYEKMKTLQKDFLKGNYLYD